MADRDLSRYMITASYVLTFHKATVEFLGGILPAHLGK